jgi:hypothetical protein
VVMPVNKGPIRHVIETLKRMFRRKPEPETPEDPHSYVTAPKKPRPSSRSAAAVAELEE